MLLVELANAGQLLLDQRDLPFLRLFLRVETLHLLLELPDALTQLGLLPGPAVDANLEQFGLAHHDVGDIGIAGTPGEFRRKIDLVQPTLFGFQPRRARQRGVEIPGDDRQIRFGDGVIKPHQDLARLDLVAVMRKQLPDDAAGRILHLLDVGLDHDLSPRDQRAGDLGGRGPAPESAGDKGDDREPDDQMQPDRALRTLWPAATCDLRRSAAHDLAAPESETILIGADAATRGCRTCPSTASFGPNACMRPSLSTRIWSTPSMPTGRCATTMTTAPRSRAERTARVRASSPSESRLEFGSSSTIRKGLP